MTMTPALIVLDAAQDGVRELAGRELGRVDLLQR